MNYSIPNKIKKISIIGEIKISEKGVNINQKKNYLSYTKTHSNSKILFLIMYIFDNSYKNFNYIKAPEKLPIIYGYAPKIYKEDYYNQNVYLKICLNDNNISFDKKIKEYLNKIKIIYMAKLSKLKRENYFLKIIIIILILFI